MTVARGLFVAAVASSLFDAGALRIVAAAEPSSLDQESACTVRQNERLTELSRQLVLDKDQAYSLARLLVNSRGVGSECARRRTVAALTDVNDAEVQAILVDVIRSEPTASIRLSALELLAQSSITAAPEFAEWKDELPLNLPRREGSPDVSVVLGRVTRERSSQSARLEVSVTYHVGSCSAPAVLRMNVIADAQGEYEVALRRRDRSVTDCVRVSVSGVAASSRPGVRGRDSSIDIRQKTDTIAVNIVIPD
jgi:hypothetical protein